MRRTLATLAVVAAGCAVLAGCGSDDSSSDAGAQEAPKTTAESAQEAGSAASGDGKALNVRVITVSPTNIGTWDPSNRRGYEAVAEQQGWKLEIAEAVQYGKAPQVLERWGAEGVDLIISTDNGFEPSIVKAAEKFPETRFIIMSDLATKKQLPNLAGYSGDWCQIGFAEGVAGALISKTHKMGYSAAIGIPPTLKAYAGMKIGAEATGIPTTVTMKQSGDFLDAPKSAETTSALMDAGADVISAIVHGVNQPIAARIQAAGKYYIGSYDDESRFAPKATPTNALFKFSMAYETVAKELAAGTFSPGPHKFGIKDGYISLTPFKLGFEDKFPKAQAIMEDAAAGKYDAQFAECDKTTT